MVYPQQVDILIMLWVHVVAVATMVAVLKLRIQVQQLYMVMAVLVILIILQMHRLLQVIFPSHLLQVVTKPVIQVMAMHVSVIM